jgi:hypothetical protein
MPRVRSRLSYYLCRNVENYGNSLACALAPHRFGGWADAVEWSGRRKRGQAAIASVARRRTVSG